MISRMGFREVSEKDKQAFNKAVSHPVQSWEWGEFRKKTGNRVLRFGAYKDKRVVEGYTLTVHSLPYTPYKLATFLKGPKPTKEMLSFLKELGKRENIIFIRMEPNIPLETGKADYSFEMGKLETLLRKNGARPGRPFFTKSTFVMDLTKSEGELLAAMHPKSRYNIRLAGRKGVEVVEDNSEKAFKTYLKLMDETTKRQGFYAHTERYHRLMWETLHKEPLQSNEEPIARLLTAKYKGEILITWVVFVWQETLYYPYGASSDKYRNVMASYAMMWEAIKFGKKLGLKKFDLWGREPGEGFTRFKEGFSPEVVEFLGTWDLVTNPALYPLYRLAEEARWALLKSPILTLIPLPKPKFR